MAERPMAERQPAESRSAESRSAESRSAEPRRGVGRRHLIAGLAAAPLVAASASLAAAAPVAAAGQTAQGGGGSAPGSPGRGREAILVIGHRGASGYRPEHTLAAYELAARMGADFIEPDLVVTRDGHLVCRHEPEIGGTTNVADRPEFATRKVTRTVDGAPMTGWFAEDFTLAELKTLRAKERLPAVRQENTMYDGRFDIPTLAEVIELRRRLSAELRREIGIYPETKHPTYFQKAGLALEQRLLDLLARNGLNNRSSPVFVQSFETSNLRELRRRGLRTKLVQLLGASGAPYDLAAAGDPRTYRDLITPAGLKEIAGYADGIGPEKSLVIPVVNGQLGAPTALVGDAHAAGLLLHPYTFRAENTFLPAELRRGSVTSDFGRGIDEQVAYLRAGIDGLFTDHPDVGVVARAEAARR